MDNAILVEELREIINVLNETQEHVALFMLTASELNTSVVQNLIVSTKGYDEMSTKDALIHLIQLLKSRLKDNILKQFGRLSILRTEDPFVKTINQMFKVETGGSMTIQSSNILGIYIENATILESVSLPKA